MPRSSTGCPARKQDRRHPKRSSREAVASDASPLARPAPAKSREGPPREPARKSASAVVNGWNRGERALRLALGAANMGDYVFILVLVLSSLLNAVYFFRLFENMFMNKSVADGSKGIGACLAVKAEKKAERDSVPFKETAATKEGYKGRLEIPPAMLFAVIVSALGIILAGLFNAQLVEILGPAIREVV